MKTEQRRAARIPERTEKLLVTVRENIPRARAIVAIQTVNTPNNGQRTVAVRRLHMTDQVDESRMLIVMIEDRTTQATAADVAA